jgi:hypothetical protein
LPVKAGWRGEIALSGCNAAFSRRNIPRQCICEPISCFQATGWATAPPRRYGCAGPLSASRPCIRRIVRLSATTGIPIATVAMKRDVAERVAHPPRQTVHAMRLKRNAQGDERNAYWLAANAGEPSDEARSARAASPAASRAGSSRTDRAPS